ncbi:hypothetical protein J7M28_01435 [bacterium]|nr:hypothetical protein [bacterium]
MENWIETVAFNPDALMPIIVAVIGILVLLMLWPISKLIAKQKDLEKERRALDLELFKLEKLAGKKKAKLAAGDESQPESFWPGNAETEEGASKAKLPEGESLSSEQISLDGEKQPGPEEDEDEFADIRKENIVRDWDG